MKKSFNLTVLAEIAIFSALAFALDIFQSGLFRGVFTNGGSIGIAMLPVLIISYRRGFVPGLICGIITSFLQMLGGVYAIASVWYNMLLQILLDYVLTYPLVAFAGLFAKSFQKATTNKARLTYLCIGSALGGVLKFLSHFLAGVLFWQNFDFVGGPAVYSLVYNGGYMLPNIIICTVILVILCIKQPSILIPDYKQPKVEEGGTAHE